MLLAYALFQLAAFLVTCWLIFIVVRFIFRTLAALQRIASALEAANDLKRIAARKQEK